MLIGDLDELFQRLGGLREFVGELDVLLVLPSVAERAEAGLERHHPVLEVDVEALEFLGETTDFRGVHDCL